MPRLHLIFNGYTPTRVKAATESPFKRLLHTATSTYPLPYLWYQIIDVKNVKMLVNYGIEKLKFGQPVLVDNEIRLKASLQNISNLRGIAKAEIKVV